MRCRPVDENGDMMPVRDSSQMLYGSDAVAAAVDSRLDLVIGDWWEDRSLGFEVPQFLIDGLRASDSNAEMLLNYISAYIMQTQGVLMIDYADYSLVKRHFAADISVKTVYGQVIGRSVGMNELLRAIP